MTSFAEAVKKQNNFTRTENGAVALRSTGHACVDFYATCGALRNADDTRITRLFADAYNEEPLTATKIAFYNRDVRGGNGERKTFRTLLRYMAEYHPEALRPNLHLIGEYGRYDDLYALIGTPLEANMWATMRNQLEKDLKALHSGEHVSLLAKWIKTADASSQNTRKLGIMTAQKLGYSVYNFKRIIRSLRKEIRIVESQISANKWGEIEYSHVPSRASLIYRNAFRKHDEARYSEYINKAVNGKAVIHSGTLYPYDLVEKVIHFGWRYSNAEEDPTVEAQWRQLPNYVDGEHNILVIADTSGSMSGRPMNTAVGLAIYFAERNKGAYHNLWMNFSSHPSYQEIRGETLVQKLQSINFSNWEGSTNLEAAFDMVLYTAIQNHIPHDEIPRALVVISDMEIDHCGDRNWSFYEQMEDEYARHGYRIPNVIFWNVDSRHDTFHADANRRGVQLFSGQSASTFKNVIACIGMTPEEAMHKVIDSDRYKAITIER